MRLELTRANLERFTSSENKCSVCEPDRASVAQSMVYERVEDETRRPYSGHSMELRKSQESQADDSHNRSYVRSIFVNQNKFCWVFLIMVVYGLILLGAFGWYSHSIKTERRLEARQATAVVQGSHWEIITEISLLSLSVASGLIVCIGALTWEAFRRFVFPGVIQLCCVNAFQDALRLLQILLNASKVHPESCRYFYFIDDFLECGIFLWVGAIALDLLLSVRKAHTQRQMVTKKLKHVLFNVVIWTSCLGYASAFSFQIKGGPDQFLVHKTNGVCYENRGSLVCSVIFPIIVLVFSAGANMIFCRKLKALYPQHTTQNICFRSNSYLWIFLASVITRSWAYFIFYFIDTSSQKNTEWRDSIASIIFSCEGFLYSCFTLREFAHYGDRADSGLHLHNIEIDEVDFGEHPLILGEGTFAVVFKAAWAGRLVAVKVFKVREVNTEQMKMEAYLAAKLVHKNLVMTYGCSLVDNNSIAIVTEYVGGGTLDDIICSGGQNYLQVLEYGQQIASGMLFLHSQSPAIVHRDLKPTNCLIDRYNCVKIADFGCSRWVLEGLGTASPQRSRSRRRAFDHTRTMTSNIGTPCWVAPELMVESTTTKYSIKVDVFSFAVIMWQLYTGKIPYLEVQGSLVALEEAVIAGHRPEIPHDCPKLLRQVIELGWDADPVKRPTFREIVLLLEAEIASVRGLRSNQFEITVEQH